MTAANRDACRIDRPGASPRSMRLTWLADRPAARPTSVWLSPCSSRAPRSASPKARDDAIPRLEPRSTGLSLAAIARVSQSPLTWRLSASGRGLVWALVPHPCPFLPGACSFLPGACSLLPQAPPTALVCAWRQRLASTRPSDQLLPSGGKSQPETGSCLPRPGKTQLKAPNRRAVAEPGQRMALATVVMPAPCKWCGWPRAGRAPHRWPSSRPWPRGFGERPQLRLQELKRADPRLRAADPPEFGVEAPPEPAPPELAPPGTSPAGTSPAASPAGTSAAGTSPAGTTPPELAPPEPAPPEPARRNQPRRNQPRRNQPRRNQPRRNRRRRNQPRRKCRRRNYMSPTMWPSGSAKSAILVSGATSVSGMITLPPSFSMLRSVPSGSSAWT